MSTSLGRKGGHYSILGKEYNLELKLWVNVYSGCYIEQSRFVSVLLALVVNMALKSNINCGHETLQASALYQVLHCYDFTAK